jgi:hypothetical protein
MVQIIHDDNLFEKIKDYDAILVGANNYCTMRNGFPRKVMLHYPYVHEMNMKTKYGDPEKIGTILECKKENEPTFILCYIANGFNFRPDLNKEFVSYDGLEKCLKLVNVLYKGSNIACTLLGNSRFDGNGDKGKIIDIFEKSCTDINVTVYDYFQKSLAEEKKETRQKELLVKERDRAEYYKMVAERKKREKMIRELNGHAGA